MSIISMINSSCILWYTLGSFGFDGYSNWQAKAAARYNDAQCFKS